jgi:hypothetical protein
MTPGSITQPNWTPTIADDQDTRLAKKFVIPARPPGLWTRVADFVPAGRKLKIQVVGTPTPKWTYDPTKAPCTADGAGTDATGALLPFALIGCLVGKVGGSASDGLAPSVASSVIALPATVTGPQFFVFAVGSFCVVQVPTSVSGTLFLTMNDIPLNFTKHTGEVEVQVYDAP